MYDMYDDWSFSDDESGGCDAAVAREAAKQRGRRGVVARTGGTRGGRTRKGKKERESKGEERRGNN